MKIVEGSDINYVTPHRAIMDKVRCEYIQKMLLFYIPPHKSI